MFKLVMSGREGSDCTAPYIVELDKPYTVAEFVEAVLTQRDREWGHIGIYDGESIFGNPRCEYRSPMLLGTLPENILNARVVKAEARGGWSLMDYLLWVE